MTVATTGYYSWSAHTPADDHRLNRCSPNLVAIKVYCELRWKLVSLGCYGERPIRGGTAPSAHSHGAAIDLRYLEAIGRDRCEAVLIPFLIDHSLELHVSSIHDYVGARIWHAGRGWKAASKKSTGGYNDPNMGHSWAGWLHIEPTFAGWSDATPIVDRLAPAPTPKPTPPVQPAPTPAPTPTPAPAPIGAAWTVTTGAEPMMIIADASKPAAPERWVTNGMVRVLPTEHSIDFLINQWQVRTGQKVYGTILQPILVSPAVLAGLPLVG